MLSASITFSISQIGNAKRDKNLLSDIYTIGNIVPHGSIIFMPLEMWKDFSLREYLIRYFYISSDNVNKSYKYIIARKELHMNGINKNYKLIPLSTKEIDLYVYGE